MYCAFTLYRSRLVLLLFCTFCKIYASESTSHTDPITTLLQDPIAALQQCRALTQHVWENSKTSEALHKNIQQQEANHPYFFLNECYQENCRFDRIKHPKHRLEFENIVSQELIAIASKGAIHYASFACGDLFQDLMLFAKTLQKVPTATITCHAIDVDFKHLIQAYTYLRNGTAVDAHSILPDGYTDFSAYCTYLKNGPCKDRWSEREEDDILCYLTVSEGGPKQMIRFLQTTYPKATLALSIYSSHQDYFASINKLRIPMPHLISAIDIEDLKTTDQPLQKTYDQCYDDYKDLCKAVFQASSHTHPKAMLYKHKSKENHAQDEKK